MAIFCTYCGRVLKEGEVCQCRQNSQPDNGQANFGQQYQQPYGQNMGQQYQQPYGQNMGQQYQQPYGQNMGQQYQQPYGQNMEQQLPMRWYKFVIYVQMILGALSLLALSMTMFTGSHYDSKEKANLIYALYPKISEIDKIYGVILVGMAILAIIIRQGLANYQRKVLNWYYAFPIAQVIFAVGYEFEIYKHSIYADWEWNDCFEDIASEVFSKYIGITIIIIVMVVLSKIYFDKRKHLFVN